RTNSNFGDEMVGLEVSRISCARVSLPMYNLPEMRPQNAAFWNALQTELETDTLFTQVCGYPLQTIYRGQAVLLAAPVYANEYCDGPTHRGVFIVGKDAPFSGLEDLRGRRFAFNSRHSNSGMNLPRRAIADIAGGKPFFGSIAETHNHPGNVERVAKGDR